jgi:arylformamidase
MEVTQSAVLPHPRQHVWEKLMDFDVLARTLPGVEKLEPVDAETCRLTVKVLVPSITGTYEGTVSVVEKQPTESYRLHGEAKGRLGWVRGDASFSLLEKGKDTEVSSTMNFQTGGVLSGVGQRFMQAIARSQVRDFFTAFERELAGTQEAAALVEAAPAGATAATRADSPMPVAADATLPRLRAVDLTHPFSMHSPGWVNYPSPKISYFQRHATHGIVSQWLETPLHISTHLDGEMHAVSGGKDIASIPLDRLFREGVIADVSDEVEDWSVITPQHITRKVEVREGDILIIHTGWHRFYNGAPEEDEVRYFCYHPGGSRELAEWIVERELSWIGVDTGSADHPMNTSIQRYRPDAAREYEKRTGRSAAADFPEDGWFPMHRIPFSRGIVHAENVGGDIAQVVNRRCLIGAFPWRFVGGEASICRIVAFLPD